MAHKFSWGVIALASLGPAALAADLAGYSGDSASIDPPPLPVAASTTAATTAAAADPLVGHMRVARVEEPTDPPAPPPASPVTAPPAPDPESVLEQRRRAALNLRQADRARAGPVGPAEACFEKLKTVFCPIIANIPGVRDMAGQVAVWGNFDCPVGATPKI